MTTTIPVPSGPTNKEIIDRAYQVLSLKDSMFGRTDEEYASAVLVLGGMMMEWPYDQLGYIYEDAAGLRAEEESGISRKWLDAVGYGLAERIAPTIGKTLSVEARRVKTQTHSRLCSEAGSIPQSQYADGTPLGAGHSRTYRPTYFSNEA